MQDVGEVDVVLFCPDDVANAACDRLAAAMDDDQHPYAPRRPPMVLSYSFDPDKGAYTFLRPSRAKNDLLPDHGRDPSLSSWLRGNSDTLRGLPARFAPVKAGSRFMNDEQPPLYTATVMWSVMLPTYIGERGLTVPADLPFAVGELTDRMRNDFGLGRTHEVLAALEFLKTARLASETPSGWEIHFRDLGAINRDISEALLHEFRSTSNKNRPARTARDSAEPREIEDGQTSLFEGAS
jgi:hypothetical protein